MIPSDIWIWPIFCNTFWYLNSIWLQNWWFDSFLLFDTIFCLVQRWEIISPNQLWFTKVRILLFCILFVSEAKDIDVTGSSNLDKGSPGGSITLTQKNFGGRHAISSEDFTNELVSLCLSVLWTFQVHCLSPSHGMHLVLLNIEQIFH